MGWIGDLWNKIQGSSGETLTVLEDLVVPGKSFGGQEIQADKCYVQLFVEALRLEQARSFATTFHGVVYAYETLARAGQPSATLAAVSKPAMLAKLDATSLSRVITVSKELMGAIPWRGGQMHLELGLFSVKSGNLMSPVLDFVTQVSSAAGISFVGTMTPFVPLLVKGMDMIAGQSGDVALEVGFDSDLDLTKTGTYAIIARPKTSIPRDQITIDPVDYGLLLNGVPLNCGYCVFSIRQTPHKADFGEIPDLKEKFAALLDAIKSNKKEDANDKLTAFRLEALTSPDLISEDADQLVQKATSLVEYAFAKPSGIAGALKGTLGAKADLPETLAGIGLYQGR